MCFFHCSEQIHPFPGRNIPTNEFSYKPGAGKWPKSRAEPSAGLQGPVCAPGALSQPHSPQEHSWDCCQHGQSQFQIFATFLAKGRRFPAGWEWLGSAPSAPQCCPLTCIQHHSCGLGILCGLCQAAPAGLIPGLCYPPAPGNPWAHIPWALQSAPTTCDIPALIPKGVLSSLTCLSHAHT